MASATLLNTSDWLNDWLMLRFPSFRHPVRRCFTSETRGCDESLSLLYGLSRKNKQRLRHSYKRNFNL